MNSSGRFVTLLTCASLVLVAGFLLALSTPVFAQGDNLVTLCFRGRTIKVPSYLVNRYTGAGATIGPCPTIPGASAPVFSTQPQSQTVYVGDSVTFSAVADGNPLPTYQWRLNGQNIAGATNAGYTIANVQLQHAGNYTAVASNNQKSVPSTAATLTVLTTSVSGSVLFENTLENGWENWSWAAVDFNTPVPARGTRSIRVEAQPYQALYFHHGAMDVSAYGSFSFWLHLGTTSFSPGNVVVQVVLNNNIEGPVVALTSQDFPSDTTAWKQVVVPLSSLGIPVGSPVTGFYIRNYSNQALPAFYVDDVTLLPPSPITSSFSLSPVTSDNGLPAHSVQWRDANGKQRSAVMVNQRPAGAGYLRQLTYQVAGVNRICRGTGADGHQGDGYVQNHTGYGGDSSSHNTPGTTIVRLAGPHHAIIAYDMPGYTISGKAVPTRVEWFFADGRPHPVFALSQDARALTGNLGADSRSPYGDVDYTGRAGAPAGGASFGDTYKFATLASNPEQLTSASPWRYNQPNTIPYAMQWCDPAQADAEMGHVATLPIGVRDQGSDPRLYQAEDIRGTEDLDGPIIHDESWAYQILNYVMPPSGPTWSRRLAWGTNWGLPGGFDNYGNTTLNPLQYSQHATSRNGSYNGTRAGGMVMTYSVFAVLGTHAGGYVDGTVGQTVKQMEAAAAARLVGAVGAVAASGPAGVGNAAAVTIPYTPAGYNPTFSTWDITAAGNTVDATLTPAAGQPLDHPIFLIHGYTLPQLPMTISTGDGLTTADVDYFATLDPTTQQLWITVNRLVASPVRLRVTPPGGGLVPEYDTWRQLYFGNTTSAEGAPDFDAESDGMTNAVEFAFNLHPWTADSSAVQPGSGTGGLPSPGRTLINGEPRLTLEYIRRKSGVSYQVRASGSTSNFQSITPVLVEGPVSVSADYERWKVADIVSISDPAVRRRFLQIFVSIP